MGRLGSMSSAVPEKFSKNTVFKNQSALPVTLIAVGVPPPVPVNVRFRILNTWPVAANVICGSPPKPSVARQGNRLSLNYSEYRAFIDPRRIKAAHLATCIGAPKGIEQVWASCAIAQGPLEVPVLDTQVNGAARSGVPNNNAVRATVDLRKPLL